MCRVAQPSTDIPPIRAPGLEREDSELQLRQLYIIVGCSNTFLLYIVSFLLCLSVLAYFPLGSRWYEGNCLIFHINSLYLLCLYEGCP
jgi:hypothetical protein